MKNVFPAFVATAILVVLASTNAAAKLYRVNNNPGITYNNVVFSNVNDAMTAANAGDTIYLEPSATSCGTSSPITVAGLTNGTSYTFTVVATNALGNSLPCAASNAVTPFSPPPIITSFTPSGASCGATTVINIFGSKFTGATAVTVGGTAAVSFTVNSDNSITAIVPSSATGIIKVTAPGGTVSSTSSFNNTTSYTAFAYIPNYLTSTVSVINTATNLLTATITVGKFPTGVSISPDGSMVIVTNNGDNTVSIINTNSNTVAATVSVGRGPSGVCFSPDSKTAYVANTSDQTVSEINTTTNTVVGTPISIGYTAIVNGVSTKYTFSPNYLSVSPNGSQLCVSTDGGLVLFYNTATNAILGYEGSSVSYTGTTGVSYSPDGTVAYVGYTVTNQSPGNAGVEVINTSNYTLLSTMTIPISNSKGVYGGVCVSPDGTKVYVTNYNTVSVFSTSSNTLLSSITLGLGNSLGIANANGSGISISPDGTLVYVQTNYGTNVINTTTNAVTTTYYPLGYGNYGIGNFIGNVATPCSAAPTITSFTPSSACQGIATTITIFGSHFTGAVSVLIGNTAATSFTVNSDNSITAIVPSNVVGAINVITTKGSATSTNLFANNGGFATYAYVPNYDGGQVSVINPATNTVITNINVGNNPNGVSVSPDGTKVYVANYGDNTVSIINTNTNTVTATVTVGKNPWGICVSPDGTKAYVSNVKDNTVSVINTNTNSVAAVVPVGINPEGISVTPDGTKVYVANWGGSSVSVISTTTNTLLATISSEYLINATNISITPDGTKVYVTNSNNVSVISTAANSVMAIVYTINGPTGISISPDGTQAYVTTVGAVETINTLLNVQTATITLGGGTYIASDINYTPDGTKALVAFANSSNKNATLNVINTATQAVTSTMSVYNGQPFNGNFIANVPQICAVQPTIVSFTPTSASTGATVTINGSGFTGTSAVSFGGVAASSFTVVSDNKITAVVGSGATGNVSVTTTGGIGGTTSVTGFNFLQLPTITSFTPTGTCPGTTASVTIFGSNFTGTTAVTIGGTAASSFTVNNGNSISAVVPANATGAIKVTNGFGAVTSSSTFNNNSGYTLYGYLSNTSGTISVVNTTTNLVTATLNVIGDYVCASPDGTKVYAINRSDNNINVFNTATNTLSSVIAVANPTTMCISPDGSKAYITSSYNNNVSIVNTTTNFLTTVTVGNSPIAVCVSPDGTMAYVANSFSNTSFGLGGTISVINTATNSVIATVPVGNAPSYLAVSPDGRKVYVANSKDGTVSVIDTYTNLVVATLTISGGGPYSLSITPDGSKVYVDGGYYYINTATNTVTTTGLSGSFYLVVSPDGTVGYASKGGNTVVINTTSNSVVATINGVTGSGIFLASVPSACPPPTISYSPSLEVYTYGTAISSISPINTGGVPVSYSISPTLPTGLTLDVSTGVISGTPTIVSASTNYTVTATNAAGSGNCTVTIAVNPSLPSAPTIGTAVASSSTSATVTFTPPANNGGANITGYTVTSSPGNKTASGTGSPITVNGLTTGTSYTFTVKATNSVGTGSASAASNAVTPAISVPAQIDITKVSIGLLNGYGNGATILINTVPDDGGSPYLNPGCIVTVQPGNITAFGNIYNYITVPGLTPGIAYTFTVAGINAVGTGQQSAPSAPYTFVDTWDAPTNVVATAFNNGAFVSFNGPNSASGILVNYTVNVLDGSGNNTTGISPVTTTQLTNVEIDGLANGTTYTFNVVSNFATYSSVASSLSNQVTPSALPPTNVVAAAGNGNAFVNFNAPPIGNFGVTIVNYIIKVLDGNGNSTGIAPDTTFQTSNVEIDGLINGYTYTFTVTALYSDGSISPASTLSNQVTCGIIAPTNVVATAFNQGAFVSFTVPSIPSGPTINYYTITVLDAFGNNTIGISPVTTTQIDSVEIDGLTNGNTYTFTVITNYSTISSSASALSNQVTPSVLPPTNVIATGDNGGALVSFTPPPCGTNSITISNYIVNIFDGNGNPTGNSPVTTTVTTNVEIDGLTNGNSYTFTVTANYSDGSAGTSALSNQVVPNAFPPTNVVATAGSSNAFVTFTPPSIGTSGITITDYTVTVLDANGNNTTGIGPIIIPSYQYTNVEIDGLTNGTTYTFTVTANYSDGSISPVSTTSNQITVGLLPPTNVIAVAGDSKAFVTFSPTSANYSFPGAYIYLDSYSVTVLDANGNNTTGITPLSIPSYQYTNVEIDGLTNGTTYTFTVTANYVNMGSGASYITVSTLSNQVTPAMMSSPTTPTINSINPTSATTGEYVTITGTGFTGASVISFGGTNATSFTVVNDNTIIAGVGSGASGVVSVTTPGGTNTLAGFTFIMPAINSIFPTTATTGASITITGFGFTGATDVNFGGTDASSFNVLNDNTITAVVGNGTSGSVNVTTAGGSILSLAGFTFTIPAITSFTPTTAAAGATVTITGSGFTGATGVSFGGVPASSFTVANDTTITALVPVGAASGSISVTTQSGNVSLPGFTFTNLPSFTYQVSNTDAFREIGAPLTGVAVSTVSSQVYSYDAANGWQSFIGTMVPGKGYRAEFAANSSKTIYGPMVTGNVTPALSPGAGSYSLVANPYDAVVDFELLNPTGGNLQDGYWYLDPTNIQNGYEGYVFYGNLTGASNTFSGGLVPNRYIQPGQAFWVQNDASGNTPSLVFSASDTVSGNRYNVFGTASLNRISIGLFANGKNLDGAVTVFNPLFTQGLDRYDGIKFGNQGENLTFLENGKDLCTDARPLPNVADKLTVHLYNLRPNTAYTLKLDATGFSGNGLQAYLLDAVSNIYTPLRDSTALSFATTSNTAMFSNRYSIVFRAIALPLAGITLSAEKQADGKVSLRWATLGGGDVSDYQVELSIDGVSFSKIGEITPTATAYSTYLAAASAASVYYRIKAIGKAGDVVFSNVAKVSGDGFQSLSVSPNPIVGNSFRVGIGAPGTYSLSIVDMLGRNAYSTSVVHATAGAWETIDLGRKPAPGSYTLRATDVNGNTSTATIIIQ